MVGHTRDRADFPPCPAANQEWLDREGYKALSEPLSLIRWCIGSWRYMCARFGDLVDAYGRSGLAAYL